VTGVLAGRYDRCGTASSYGVVALAGVERAVGGDAGDLVLGRDLVEQFGQHGRIADLTGGELGGTDFQGFLVNPDVDLAPDAALGSAMLAPSSGKQSPGLFADPPLSIPLRLPP